MSNLRVQFATQLKLLRKQKNLTQEELAEAMAMSVEFISNLERGINAPSFETLEKLAIVLNVTVRDLFDF